MFRILILIALCGAGCASKPRIHAATGPLPTSECWTILHSFEQARRIEYQWEWAADYWQSPAETNDLGTGDCEDKALYLRELWRRHGITNHRIVFGKGRLSDPSLHAWNEITVAGETYIFDATLGRIARKRDLPSDEFIEHHGGANLRRKLAQVESLSSSMIDGASGHVINNSGSRRQ